MFVRSVVALAARSDIRFHHIPRAPSVAARRWLPVQSLGELAQKLILNVGGRQVASNNLHNLNLYFFYAGRLGFRFLGA